MDKIRVIRNISNPFNEAPVYYIDKTGTTMKLARDYCRMELKKSSLCSSLSGTVFMADLQTHGRGRIPGRIWQASKGKNLLFTLILSGADMGENPLPVVVGLGISRYLKNRHGISSSIKWPNDILVGGKKLSGIIIESGKNYYNIGIGININQINFPESIVSSATSVSLEKNQSFNIQAELESILKNLKAVLRSDSWNIEVNSMLYRVGEKISMSTGIPGHEKIITGIVKGVGSMGQLLLEDGSVINEIYSGELCTGIS